MTATAPATATDVTTDNTSGKDIEDKCETVAAESKVESDEPQVKGEMEVDS